MKRNQHSAIAVKRESLPGQLVSTVPVTFCLASPGWRLGQVTEALSAIFQGPDGTQAGVSAVSIC